MTFRIAPCTKGHIGGRSAVTGKCLECNREKQRRWREKNPDKNRDIKKKWVLENRDKRLQSTKRYYQNNREKARDYARRNASKINEYQKARSRKVFDLIAVLRAEMPELLKEIGL